MHAYIKPLAELFHECADPAIAAGQAAYMRNQFAFFGIKTPLRRELSNAYIKNNLPEYETLTRIIKEMWAQPQREYQYVAIELVAAMRKQWTMDVIQLAEYMIVHKSWWDTVDAIITGIAGPYFRLFPEQTKAITGKWNLSNNFWLQRSSILFQLSYKAKTDTGLLTKYILHCAGSDEFFIQKAIGWALRQYARTNAQWVTEFVHANKLASLSKREALRKLH